MATHYFRLTDVSRIMRNALKANDEPETVLAAIRDMRASLREMEATAVAQCIANGMSLTGIAQELGVSKQAAHKKWSHLASSTKGN